MIILSPSLLSVDFAHIADGIAELDRAKVPALHLDVMDGAFVPNTKDKYYLFQSEKRRT